MQLQNSSVSNAPYNNCIKIKLAQLKDAEVTTLKIFTGRNPQKRKQWG